MAGRKGEFGAKKAEKRGFSAPENIQHPTTNVEHPFHPSNFEPLNLEP